MNPKAEFALIMFLSICVPLVAYSIAFSHFNTVTEPANITEQVEQKEKSGPLSLLFIGDIMIDRTIRKDGEAYGYDMLFSCLQEEFSKHDAVIGNLEGTITDFPSVSRDASYEAPESFRFTFDPKGVQALRDIGLSIVSIGNNHIRDFGDEGVRQTVSYAYSMNLPTFGDPRVGQKGYTIQAIGDTSIAFIAHNQFFGTEQGTLAELREVQSISDLQVIFAHWGDEYVPAREDTKAFARSLVDNGADLVIGAHPHVIQEREQYEGAWIYYSLGNFIFDQYWEDAVRKGLGVQVSIENKKIQSVSELDTLSTRHKGTCFVK